MNTYEWVCGGCETKNVKFVEPEDGKQVTLECKKCGAPWMLEEQVNYERIIRSLEVSEALASTCSTTFQPPDYHGDQFERYADMQSYPGYLSKKNKVRPKHWRV